METKERRWKQRNEDVNKEQRVIFGGGESLIKSEKTSAHSMFEKNMERFGGSWFSVTHPHNRVIENKEGGMKEISRT
jgi:hypothetical protein